jgi:hypothetical protein
MSALKVGFQLNSSVTLETALTFHSLIAPYVALAGFSIQPVAALLMLPSVSGVTASAHGVRSRTCAARMAHNDMSRVGVMDLDFRAVVEPVLAQVVAISLGSVRCIDQPESCADICTPRDRCDRTRGRGASHARPTNRTNPAPDAPARHACTGAEPGATNLRVGKARR